VRRTSSSCPSRRWKPIRPSGSRRPLPDHLPRESILHQAPHACPSCGGALRRIGEDVSETLDYVPGRFKVVRHVREKLSCRACDTVVAAPAPDHAIARGRAGTGLLAHIVVSKYDDHLPLYRQAEIFAREGVNLETSTLSGWVGATAAALQPLLDALAAEVMASDILHVDDTPVPVLAPGTGKTKTGRLWTYVRDERPFAGARPPAALFFYSPDRKGEHPRAHLKDFRGVIHADGYAGFNELFAGGRITEAGCWAHVRRKFFDVHAAIGSPIAKEALDRIGQLYHIEQTVAGMPPDHRRRERQQRSTPVAKALATWAGANCPGPDLPGMGPIPRIAGRSPSYIVRQLYDFQHGVRAGPSSPLMTPNVIKLTTDDMVALAAYAASLPS
jgi:transposase